MCIKQGVSQRSYKLLRPSLAKLLNGNFNARKYFLLVLKKLVSYQSCFSFIFGLKGIEMINWLQKEKKRKRKKRKKTHLDEIISMSWCYAIQKIWSRIARPHMRTRQELQKNKIIIQRGYDYQTCPVFKWLKSVQSSNVQNSSNDLHTFMLRFDFKRF